MESVKVNIKIDKVLEEELARVRRAIQGVGDESYLSFSRLLNESEKVTRYMNRNTQQQIYGLRQVIQMLEENEAAQKSLLQKLKEGCVTSREYAENQASLSEQEADLKVQIADLNDQLERQIQLMDQSFRLREEEVEGLSKLKDAYKGVIEQKLIHKSIGGEDKLELEIAKENDTFKEKQKGELPPFSTLAGGMKSFKAAPTGFLIEAGYELATGAVQQSKQLSKTVDMGMGFIKALLKSNMKTLASYGSIIYDFLTGEWKNAAYGVLDNIKNDSTKVLQAWDASTAVSYQYHLEDQVSLHSDLIKLNNQQVLSYCKSMQDANITLEERQRLLRESTKLEDENQKYRSSDLAIEYNKVFRLNNQTVYDGANPNSKKDFSLLENYFKVLNNGENLDLENKNKLMEVLHRVTTNPRILWDEEDRSQFKSFFTRAEENNRVHLNNINFINTLFRQGQAATTGKQPSSVVSNEATSTSGLSVVGTQPTFFDPEPLRAELEDKKQFYQEDVNAYIAYLQEKIAAAKANPAPEGRLEEKMLNRELGSAERAKDNRLGSLLSQYQGYVTKMTSLTRSYQADMALLNQAMTEASTEEEKRRIEEAIDLRTDGYTASLAGMEAEHAGFSKVLFGDLQSISKEALNRAIAEARTFIAQWTANAGELSLETEKVIRQIQEGIDKAEASVNGGGEKKDKFELADRFRDAASALQGCADLANVFDESLGSVIQTAADVAAGAADIAAGIATFSANPLQGATGILSGVTHIFGSIGKRIEENKQIREEYMQGLTETYSKELEYNSLLRERLRIQQQLGETSLDYSNRLKAELGKQQGDISREYTEVWNKLMKEQYVSGTGYQHGTWFRKAKIWNEYSSLAGKSYEEIESLYTQDKLEGSAKTLFERLRELKEEGADVVDMMDQLGEEMKENWTGTTTSVITDSIMQGFLDGKRSAADFADSFQDMMKTAMMQSVKMKYLEGPLDEWYNRFAEASEGGLTEEKIAELRKQYEQIIENAAREAENMEAITGLASGAEAAREATAQGIASMGQETATELNGNFYALQYLTSNIDRNVTNIQSVLYQASDQWIRIEENTRYCRKLETMERDMASVRKDMQEITNKGILMRTR